MTRLRNHFSCEKNPILPLNSTVCKKKKNFFDQKQSKKRNFQKILILTSHGQICILSTQLDFLNSVVLTNDKGDF